MHGIDPQDTIAHYDTIGGKRYVEPSNCVCIYAPRFAAVRQITAPALSEHQEEPVGATRLAGPAIEDLAANPGTVTQPIPPERHVAVLAPYGFRERTPPIEIGDIRPLLGIEFPLLPYENLNVVRLGIYDGSEKARLAEAVLAAKTWTVNEGVEVLIDGRAAFEAVAAEPAEEVHRYEVEGKPRLCVVKLASRRQAQPGDMVEFTIRFDNVGDEPLGNVTIIDHLTPRLEYVENSAKSTLDANFGSIDKDGQTLILRWEIKNPLKVGEGGVIHFQCRVR